MKISQLLQELQMTPKSLASQVANIDALVGMEFEMYVPGAGVPDEDDLEVIEDMSHDFRPTSIQSIINFYQHGDHGLTRDEINVLEDRLNSDYNDYIEKEIEEMWLVDGFDFFKDFVDPSDIPEDETIEEMWEAHYGIGAKLRAKAFESFTTGERDNPPSVKSWLRDESMADMSDINEHLGYTWPYTTTEEPPDTEWDMKDVAKSFSKTVGRDVDIEGSGGGGKYGLTTDGSLSSPNTPSDGGLEFISPPLSVSEMIHDLHKVREWAAEHDCYTTEETGLHINVSLRNANWDQLDYVKLAIMLGDNYVAEQFDRINNYYAASAFDKIGKIIRDKPELAVDMLIKMKTHMDALSSRIIHDLATSKYTSINLKLNLLPAAKRVEFRSPGGDYLGRNFHLIENTMMRFIVALDSALDPEKDRKEYMKKLYKVLGQTLSNGIDITKIFAEFSTGPKDSSNANRIAELKATIKLFKPSGTPSPAALPREPQKPAAGSVMKPQEKPSRAATQLNNYLHNVATNISKVKPEDRDQLIGELVTVMTDRRGYPEWENAVATAKQIIKRSGLDPATINAYMQKLISR